MLITSRHRKAREWSIRLSRRNDQMKIDESEISGLWITGGDGSPEISSKRVADKIAKRP